MLGMEKSLGAVAPGFYADIVAVEGDPLANISAVSRRDLSWVMKSDRVVVDKIKSDGTKAFAEVIRRQEALREAVARGSVQPNNPLPRLDLFKL